MKTKSKRVTKKDQKNYFFQAKKQRNKMLSTLKENNNDEMNFQPFKTRVLF